jgi:membrane protein YqaA with SNARE-associated domain
VWFDLIIGSFLSHFAIPMGTETAWFSWLSFDHPHLFTATGVAIIVSTLAYMVSYWLGTVFSKEPGAWRISEEKFAKAQRFSNRWLAPLWLFPWIPLLPILTLGLGFCRVDWFRLFLYVVIGRFIYYTYYLHQAGYI